MKIDPETEISKIIDEFERNLVKCEESIFLFTKIFYNII